MTIPILEGKRGQKLAYHLSEGKGPCVVFCGGFKSNMAGSKALALEEFCKKRGQRFLRFDYTGHGQSSGKFEDGGIGNWQQDALDIITQLTQDKIILVGSSMGAWIMLLVALKIPERIAGMIGVASAPDFTEKLIWQQCNDEQKKQLLEHGQFVIPDCYGEEPYAITRQLIEEGRYHLLLDRPIALNIPVRLIHGISDADVPWQFSVKLMECLSSTDIQLTLVKGGNHRMSEPDHLALLCEKVGEFI